MSKERFAAFFDAVFAIIMTILVLELERPDPLTWGAIWGLRTSYFAYAISFFWLGTMWINIHNEWEHVKQVSIKSLWLGMILLFFSSLFPYTTSLVSKNFYNSVAQVIYGIIVLCVTFTFVAWFNSIAKDNKKEAAYVSRRQSGNNRKGFHLKENWMQVDIALKIIGLILSATVFPPAMMFSVLLTLLTLVLPHQLKSSK